MSKRITELPLKSLGSMGLNDFLVTDNEVEALSSKTPINDILAKIANTETINSSQDQSLSGLQATTSNLSSRLNSLEYDRTSSLTVNYFAGASRLALGQGAGVTSTNGLAIMGYTQGQNSISIGFMSGSKRAYDISFGYQATSSYNTTGNGGNLSLGAFAEANHSSSGAYATSVGFSAKANNEKATALGYQANASKIGSIAIGDTTISSGVWSVAIGTGAEASDSECISIGSGAKASYLYGIALGSGAYAQGATSTSIGYGSVAGNTEAVSIGYGASTYTAYRIHMGNANTRLECYGSVINASDLRDKVEVKDLQAGLSLINKLRPVEYHMNYRVNYAEGVDGDPYTTYNKKEHALASKKSKRKFYGLIAQDVAKVIDPNEYNVVGDDHYNTDGEGKMHLSYDSFIAPLIKAVQELSTKVEAQAKKIKKLEKVGK